MGLVEPKALSRPSAERVLIKAEPQVMKEGFSIVNELHEAGYVAEFYLVGQELANWRWTLDVRSKTPLFVFTDQLKHRKFEVQTSSEVLAILEGGSADKGSLA